VVDPFVGAPPGPDVSPLLGRMAGALAEGGEAALPAVLRDLVVALGLSSAVLREAGPLGPLLAVAGEVVHAVPHSRRSLGRRPTVELPVRGSVAATLTVVGAQPTHLPVLRAAASVLGLALARVTAPDRDLEAALLVAHEQDLDDVADDLHDGAIQALAGARWALDAATRETGPDVALAAVRTALQETLVGLRHVVWNLRGRGGDDLSGALVALSAALVAAGHPALEVSLSPLPSPLPAEAAAAVYRLVQAVGVGSDVPVRVVLAADGDRVVLDVTGGGALRSPDRWLLRARALGGDLSVRPGSLRLLLPRGSSPLPDVPKAVL